MSEREGSPLRTLFFGVAFTFMGLWYLYDWYVLGQEATLGDWLAMIALPPLGLYITYQAFKYRKKMYG